ncbi:hypothetical protein C8Q75DRAFT_803841 [Abortiporus biennis]|nr:hypothetical protein C8Q75DRAFT_803841 [Abortiporus biennis]
MSSTEKLPYETESRRALLQFRRDYPDIPYNTRKKGISKGKGKKGGERASKMPKKLAGPSATVSAGLSVGPSISASAVQSAWKHDTSYPTFPPTADAGVSMDTPSRYNHFMNPSFPPTEEAFQLPHSGLHPVATFESNDWNLPSHQQPLDTTLQSYGLGESTGVPLHDQIFGSPADVWGGIYSGTTSLWPGPQLNGHIQPDPFTDTLPDWTGFNSSNYVPSNDQS